MEIDTVTFRTAALRPGDVPREPFPHIAISGRSNVGKSSLLNWLFRRPLAKTAKAPGKTRTLNFYLVNRSFYMVDLPGYGYAKVARSLREQWGEAIGGYLVGDDRIAGVLCLVDIRHDPTPLDLDLQALLATEGRPRKVVLTKADKLSRGRRATMRHRAREVLGLDHEPLAVSVADGEGRSELLKCIDTLVAGWRQAHQLQRST